MLRCEVKTLREGVERSYALDWKEVVCGTVCINVFYREGLVC